MLTYPSPLLCSQPFVTNGGIDNQSSNNFLPFSQDYLPPDRKSIFPSILVWNVYLLINQLSLGEGNIVPVRETSITKNVLTGWSKSDTSSPLTGGDPTSTGPSGGDATTISSSTPTGSTSSTTKSDSTPTSSTGATTKSDSTPAGGTGATTKPGSIPQPADGTGAITESQSTPTGGTGTTTKSESTPTGGTGATTKSESTPTGGTDSGSSSGSGSGSRGSSGGTVAPAATFTAPGGSTGVAARNGGSVVALVLLGSLVGLLGSR